MCPGKFFLGTELYRVPFGLRGHNREGVIWGAGSRDSGFLMVAETTAPCHPFLWYESGDCFYSLSLESLSSNSVSHLYALISAFCA